MKLSLTNENILRLLLNRGATCRAPARTGGRGSGSGGVVAVLTVGVVVLTVGVMVAVVTVLAMLAVVAMVRWR